MSKHLSIARSEGAQAGLDALTEYLESPLGSTNPRVADVREALARKRTDRTRLAFYCETFGVSAKPKAAKKGATVVKAGATRRTRKARNTSSAISKGVAWELLGGNEDFEPNDPDAPASGGQLYRLNVEGFISLS